MNKIKNKIDEGSSATLLGEKEAAHGTPHFQFQALSQEDCTGQFFAPYHWHDEVELLHVTDGAIQVKTENGTDVLHAGQVYFINPSTVHGIFGDSLHSHHYALVFPLSLLSFAQYDACQNTFLTPLLSGKLQFPTGTALSAQTAAKIGERIRTAAGLYLNESNPSATAPLSIKIALLQILELLFQEGAFLSAPTSSGRGGNDDGHPLKTVFSYIEEHYQEKIALEDLSLAIPMNKNYFCKYFKEKTGKTPFAYLNEYRVNQAAMRLLTSDASITDTAFAAGFDNMSYFIRQFRHYKGCTPSAFRRREEQSTERNGNQYETHFNR